MEDFFQLLFQEKEGKLPIAEGFLRVAVAGGIFSHWMVLTLLLSMSHTAKMLL